MRVADIVIGVGWVIFWVGSAPIKGTGRSRLVWCGTLRSGRVVQGAAIDRHAGSTVYQEQRGTMGALPS